MHPASDAQADDDEKPIPSWRLHTPIRSVEWWGYPALVAGVAALICVAVATRHPRPPVFAVVMTSGTLAILGAVVLAVVGRVAFSEQSDDASWRLHQTRVVVGNAVMLLVALVALLSSAAYFTAVLVAAGGVSGVSSYRRDAPKFDHVVAIMAAAVLAIAVATTITLAFLDQSLPAATATTWAGSGFVSLPVLLIAVIIKARQVRGGRFGVR